MHALHADEPPRRRPPSERPSSPPGPHSCDNESARASSTSAGQRPSARGPKSGPASRRQTDRSGLSLRRAARTQPAVPPPTTTTSKRTSRSIRPRGYAHERGPARRLLAADTGLVHGCVSRADGRAGAGLAGDRARRARPDPGADGLGKDARGVPLRHRPAQREPRAGAAPALRLAAQGAELRRRAQPAEPAGRPALGARGRRPHRGHARGRAPADAQDAAGPADHDPGVALPAAHVPGPRDARRGRDGDRRRGACRRGHEAGRPPGTVARASRAARRGADPAHRALRDAAPARGDRPLRRRRRAPDRARGRRLAEGARPRGRRPARGHARARRDDHLG